MASSISEAQAELISSLSPDDIPIKLRCAICSKLAINAFRLPCCDQAICEHCQSALPQSCPVCEHSPLAAETCNPNKALRTTIRVFLRTAEKKREASRSKEATDPTPAPSVEAAKPSVPVAEPAAQGSQSVNEAAVTQEAPRPSLSGDEAAQDVAQAAEKLPQSDDPDKELSTDAPPNQICQTSTDNSNPPQASRDGQVVDLPAAARDADGDEDAEEAPNAAQDMTNGQAGYGMDGGFPNMMYPPGVPPGVDFNQMQMMMAMQNGMGTAAFGGFPMMGMGMDPMTMQNMYMNGGFQGMGMNGMGGFGGGFGQGSNNNWHGSQSWNFDENNYNQSGDYFNAGFQTGYNQGNYGGRFHDYRRSNFGRGRGRGRGYYGGYGGRGGHYQDNQDQQGAFLPQQAHGYKAVEMEARGVQEHGQSYGGRRDQGGQEEESGGGAGAEAAREDSGGQLASSSRENLGNEAADGDVSRNAADAGAAIRSVISAPDVPINAPTGPKAMRQGLPNTSLHHLRARGYQVDSAADSVAAAAAAAAQEQQQAADNESQRGLVIVLKLMPISSSEKQRETMVTCMSQTAEIGRRKASPPEAKTAAEAGAEAEAEAEAEAAAEAEAVAAAATDRTRASRKHRDDDDERYPSISKDERRSRSGSPERRDRDRERRAHRDRSRDRERGRGGRDGAREREREYEDDYHHHRRSRDRRERRDRHRHSQDRHHHHHHDHHHHRDHRHHPPTDAHTLEREARNRQRLAKEAQRIAGLAGSKRGREAETDTDDRKVRRVPSSQIARRDGVDEEMRMRRLEVEREGVRWD
ncbi:pre-mRNA-splicing factor 38B [Ophiocordyceps camponoti-floridani]|uniref:Pre-mRNA-splicing factor 38B n=1 Tax=Ophiocordyceps camponoti-floridani TaxID=2030778 RepID=A0A8H4Q9E5_9HYPO|nr:pre-mRNA-splicing factor 38B [Ophiocordyceps camponoti-floridani]